MRGRVVGVEPDLVEHESPGDDRVAVLRPLGERRSAPSPTAALRLLQVERDENNGSVELLPGQDGAASRTPATPLAASSAPGVCDES